MKRLWIHPAILIAFAVLFTYGVFAPSSAHAQDQQPTATPASGMYITVITEEPVINVRMGPSSTVYPVVGQLARGATAPALGRSPGGDWIQIEFPGAPNNMGWVYSPLVQVSPGTLRISEPPPTPIPPATATIDPTFAAQFTIIPTQPRLPTFTPPPALVVPSYTQKPAVVEDNPVPLGMVIIALAVLGVIIFLFSLLIKQPTENPRKIASVSAKQFFVAAAISFTLDMIAAVATQDFRPSTKVEVIIPSLLMGVLGWLAVTFTIAGIVKWLSSRRK
jgi:uncharacterized protein YraI